MIDTILTSFPYKQYNNAFDSIINDTLRLTNNTQISSSKFTYKLFEEDNNIIFKCLATGLSEEDLDINFKDKTLQIKTTNEDLSDYSFCTSINKKFSLFKDIDASNSFAKLDKGILTITMPLKESKEDLKISFK